MLFSASLFANSAILIANILFMISLMPQIFLNYKLKSTRGLSDIFILASLNGQCAYLGYAFFANLPFIYKIINPIYAVLVFFIIFQRFYYAKDGECKTVLWIYVSNLFLLIMIMFLVFNGFVKLGYILGWIPSGIGLWKKVPQMFKVYRSKSVYGFSLFFILISLTSYAFESIAGLILHLPTPVLFNDLRGFCVNLVFVFQFWLYR